MEKDLKSQGQATLFFSIDFEINNPLFTDPKRFARFLELQAQGQFLYVFLDEFQYLQEAGRFLKSVFDALKDKAQLIVSGSCSLEITKNSEFLTGRKIEFHLPPFTFKEFLIAKSPYRFEESFSWESFTEIREFDLMYQEELKRQLAEYAQWGGYPEVVRQDHIEKKQTILQELVSTYIQKDVVGFLKVEKVQEFNTLVAVLAAQTGNLVKKDDVLPICHLPACIGANLINGFRFN